MSFLSDPTLGPRYRLTAPSRTRRKLEIPAKVASRQRWRGALHLGGWLFGEGRELCRRRNAWSRGAQRALWSTAYCLWWCNGLRCRRGIPRKIGGSLLCWFSCFAACWRTMWGVWTPCIYKLLWRIFYFWNNRRTRMEDLKRFWKESRTACNGFWSLKSWGREKRFCSERGLSPRELGHDQFSLERVFGSFRRLFETIILKNIVKKL